ncbi:MAG: acyl carrier protein [Hyphomonadaceae bacterium]|nr:acyl carrier protein [Clostridia bacterium]
MVFEKIRAVIVDQLGVDEDEVTMEASFLDDLGADSLDIAELAMAMEEEFELQISDGEIDKIQTVGDVVNYVKANV